MLSGAPVTAAATPEALLERFQAANGRQRRAMVGSLEASSQSLRPLIANHLERLDPRSDDWAAGFLIQLLLAEEDGLSKAFLARHGAGWLASASASALSFEPLQRALMFQQFELADRLTSALLRQLAGPAAERRGYVYYSEVATMPELDLESLDRLWVCFSRGRFGFSVQARLLASSNGRFDQLWPKLAWKQGRQWTRYPGSFQWSIGAPEGHMPLVNQLRGVRLMDALLSHPAVQRRMGGGAGGPATA